MVVLTRSCWTSLWFATSPGLSLTASTQYNGLLFALFFFSVWLCARQHAVLAAACYFVLLASKHMFAYWAFGYGVWGLCTIVAAGWAPPGETAPRGSSLRAFFRRLVLTTQLVSVLLIVVSLAIGPFVVSEWLYLQEDMRVNHYTLDDRVVRTMALEGRYCQ